MQQQTRWMVEVDREHLSMRSRGWWNDEPDGLTFVSWRRTLVCEERVLAL